MHIILDIIPLAIVTAFYFIGKHAGFFGMLFGMFRGIIALLAAVALSGLLSGMIYEKALAPKNEMFIKEITEENKSAVDTYKTIDAVCKKLNITELSSSDKADSYSKITEQTQNGSSFEEAVIDTLIKPVQMGAIKSFVTSIGFFVIFFLLGIVMRLLKIINNLPLIGAANKVLGGIFGALEGIIFGFAACIIIYLICNTANSGLFSLQTLEQTFIVKSVWNILFGG